MRRGMLVGCVLVGWLLGCERSSTAMATKGGAMVSEPAKEDSPVSKTEAEWRELLTPAQFYVLRQKGTEPPFTGAYHASHDKATYVCAGCGAELFRSEEKFDSGTGWPSFTEPVKDNVIQYEKDSSFGMTRVEVMCNVCDCHLGHVFPDGPAPSGLRFCINSASIKLIG